jgi:hypothetical protein
VTSTSAPHTLDTANVCIRAFSELMKILNEGKQRLLYGQPIDVRRDLTIDAARGLGFVPSAASPPTPFLLFVYSLLGGPLMNLTDHIHFHRLEACILISLFIVLFY